MKMQKLLFALITLLGCGICAAKDTCFDCHRDMEGMSHTFTNDIHFAKSISCANCHGGDQNEPDQNLSMSADRGFKVRVKPQGVPAFCAGCHSNTNFMAQHNPNLPTDQLAQYTNSMHGKALAAGVRKVAQCGSCHTVHTTRAVSDPLSAVNPRNISQTCTKCHTAIGQAFANSRHGRQFTNARRAGCTVCHSAHALPEANSTLLTGNTSVCAPCHRAGTRPASMATEMAQYLATIEKAGPAGKEALARAAVAVHSLNVQGVRQAAQSLPAPATEPK
jgi:predicted CXXCH cytochrome family protein